MKKHVTGLGTLEIIFVAPAKAGVQKSLLLQEPLDSGLRRKDGAISFSPIILSGF